MISGITILKNGVKLGYPFREVILAMVPICDEIIVIADSSTEDGTIEALKELQKIHPKIILIESVWNTQNMKKGSELIIQKRIGVKRAKGDWILYLEADEVLHEKDYGRIYDVIDRCEKEGFIGISMIRWYFFKDLKTYRTDWTQPLIRLYKKDMCIEDDESAGMNMIPKEEGKILTTDIGIYHYSRIGDPKKIAERMQDLDTLYHPPEEILKEFKEIDYNFPLNQVDNIYNTDACGKEYTEEEVLGKFEGTHPKIMIEHFGRKQ